MKKILLFGGTGFLGKNFLDYFHQKKEYLIIAPTRKECDLLDREATIEYITRNKPDFIVNSAFIGVNSSKEYSEDYFYNNLHIVTNILEGAREHKNLKKIVHFGSSLEYKDTKQNINETFPLEPKNTYALIKMTSSMLALSLSRQWKIPFILLRPFNLYGPHDNKTVIYYFISSILHKKSIIVTKGEQIRDYIYVKDFMVILAEVIKKYKSIPNYEAYNVAPGQGVKISKLFKTVVKEMNFQGKIKTKEYHPNEYFSNVADISKIESIIKMPEWTSLHEGIVDTINWIKTYK